MSACDPRVKLAAALAALGVALSATSPVTPLLVFALTLASIALAGCARRAFRPLSGLVATAAIPLVLVLFARGPEAALAIFARVLSAGATGVLLALTTELQSLLGALAWFRVPRAFLEITMLAHRYAGVLGETAARAREAQRLRLGWQGARRVVHSVGVLAGLVVGRAVDQTTSLSEALALRGFQGRLWLEAPGPLGARDALLASSAAVALGLSALGGLAW